MKLKIALLLIASLFFVDSVHAACSWVGNTGTAASCTVAEVGNCVSDASGKTGAVIIELPTCSVTWSSSVSVDMSSGFSNVTSLTIKGAGTYAEYGSATSGGTTLNDGNFEIVGSTDKKWRLSNIKITGSASGDAYIGITGTSRPPTGGFRIDHMTFNTAGTGDRAIMIAAKTYGVIDHCNGGSSGQFMAVYEEYGAASGNASWNTEHSFGTANAVFIEDNVLVCGYSGSKLWFISDGVAGSRLVIRHNTLTNYYIGGHDCSSLDNTRSQFSTEIYNNTMTSTHDYVSSLISYRGGSLVAYNNTFITTEAPTYETADAINLYNYRSWDYADGTPWDTACSDSTRVKICTDSAHEASSCSTDANCGGVSGSCQWADDSAGDGYGYPCRDQIGRSTNQTLYPALFWNNTIKKGEGETGYTSPQAGNDESGVHIQNNRDYCYHNTTMPASCGGVETTYTAYTYPHPLLGEETQYTLTVTPAGTGTGTVTSSPAGIDCGATCEYDFDQDTEVTLTATPAEGNAFVEWSGTDCSGSGTCVVIMDEDRDGTATFTPTYTLSLTVAGTGTCTVTSSPAGINSTTSTTHDYNDGTTVTLTATPAGGSTFAGWSGTGGCSGTSTCEILVDNSNDAATATCNIIGGTAGSAAVGTTGSMSFSASGTGSITIVP